MDNVNIILEHMTDAMLITNPTGKILFFNDVMRKGCDLFHKSLRSGMSILDLASPERAEIVKHILHEISERRKPQISEAEYKLPDGQMMYYEVLYNPVLDEENNLDRICVVSRDITTQKSFEHKTASLLRELQTLIERANAVIFGVDGGGYITEWNQESERITGYEKSDVYAHRILLLVEQKKAKAFEEMLQKLASGIPVSNFEIRIKTKTGQQLSLLLNATPRLSATGNVIGSLFVGQDITELTTYRSSLEQKVEDRTQELREALQKEKELVEMKNKFVSIASHEFRVPLASIGASVEALRQALQLDATDKLKLENIQRQVGHMNTLLEDVLTIGKSNTLRLKATFSQVDLKAFLKIIIDEVLVNARHSHRVVVELPEEPLVLESDERLLRNVFINLLNNAIKFSPGKEMVQLRAEYTDEHIRITVRDFGIGISASDLERVFEPFNRGTNASGIKGTGLGLSIVKKAVEALNGRLSVESQVDHGTVFSISLRIRSTYQ